MQFYSNYINVKFQDTLNSHIDSNECKRFEMYFIEHDKYIDYSKSMK